MMKIRYSGDIISAVSCVVTLTVLITVCLFPLSDPVSLNEMPVNRRISEKNMNTFIDIRNIFNGQEREINYRDRIENDKDRAEHLIVKDGFAI